VLCGFYLLQICIATLKHPRWVKLGILFYTKVDTLKKISVAKAMTQKENTEENTFFQEQT
jgi:hypothetical protein